VAVAEHLGMAAQLVGVVQVVSGAAGKEQTEIPQLLVQMEQQILVAVAVPAMSIPVAMVDPELSLFVMEFGLDFQQFYLMLITELELKQPIFQLQTEELFQAQLQLPAQALSLLDGIQLQMVRVPPMH
jgi:hypothetical protein